MKTNQILMLAGLGVLGFVAYQYFSTPRGPLGYNYIPPGGSWNGIQNTGTQPQWVNIVNGILTGLNAAGQVVTQIPWNQFSSGGGYTGGNLNPDSGNGYWDDSGGAVVWVPNA